MHDARLRLAIPWEIHNTWFLCTLFGSLIVYLFESLCCCALFLFLPSLSHCAFLGISLLLCHRRAADPGAAGPRAVGGSGRELPNMFAVMEDVNDKLKLLDYENE